MTNDGPDPTGSLVFFRDRFGDVLIQQQYVMDSSPRGAGLPNVAEIGGV
jgi:hypothetical protein